MATYVFTFDGYHQYQFETFGEPFSDSDAFELLDALDTLGRLDASTSKVSVKRDIEADIPDPR